MRFLINCRVILAIIAELFVKTRKIRQSLKNLTKKDKGVYVKVIIGADKVDELFGNN